MKLRFKVVTVILFTLTTVMFIYGFINYNKKISDNLNQVVNTDGELGQNTHTEKPNSTVKVDRPVDEKDLKKVPDILGLKKTEALSILKERNLTSDVLEEYSSIYDKDRVFWQNITPGEEIKANENFVFSISKGPKDGEVTGNIVSVPSLIGMEENEAASSLVALGFKVEYEYNDNQDYEEGFVYSQNYLVDAKVEKGTMVKIRVSRKDN